MEEIIEVAANGGFDWATVLVSALGGGGVLYLLIDRIFSRKRENAETGTINNQNNMSAVEMYRSLDTYVEDKIEKYGKKTEERMNKMEGRIETLERLKCFNTECRKREYFPPEDGSEALKMNRNSNTMEVGA